MTGSADSALAIRPPTAPVHGAHLGPPASARAEPTLDELALEAQRGAARAFEALVTRLQGPLYHFLWLRTGNAAEAEELCQDAFLRAWEKLDRYDARWRFTTWLFTLAKRLAASRARRRRPQTLSDGALAGTPGEALAALADETEPSARVERDEERSQVWSLAARILPPEQRSALWLRYGEDLSIEEIARILGKRRVTVRVLLFRAREALSAAVLPPPHRDPGGRR